MGFYPVNADAHAEPEGGGRMLAMKPWMEDLSFENTCSLIRSAIYLLFRLITIAKKLDNKLKKETLCCSYYTPISHNTDAVFTPCSHKIKNR